MENPKPLYFYIAHFNLYHDLVLQNIAEFSKIFTRNDSDACISFTEIKDKYVTLIVQSPNFIEASNMELFEDQFIWFDDAVLLFTQSTYNIKDEEVPFSPTYVYSAYLRVNYNWFQYHFWSGRALKKKLKKFLIDIPEGSYYFHFSPKQLGVSIESLAPIEEKVFRSLLAFLKDSNLSLKTSFQNFSIDPLS